MFADFWHFDWVPYPMTEWWFMGVMACACVGLFFLMLGLVIFILIRVSRK